MESVRWGIFGTGDIAHGIAGDFQFVADADLAAVASRTPGRAEAFARRFGVPCAHGSYRAMLEDASIDAVYIATPHSHHHDLALAAIGAGKAVVVEKSFTATYAGAQRIVEAARAKGVFAMEAMWTRFLPAISAAREVVAWTHRRCSRRAGRSARPPRFRSYPSPFRSGTGRWGASGRRRLRRELRPGLPGGCPGDPL